MSHEEKQEVTHEIAEIIRNGKEFDRIWNIRKIVAGIGTLIACTFYMGMQVSDWRTWRNGITKDVEELKQEKQTVQNNIRADKNKNVTIKTGQ